jgi:hypothetical protein
MYNELFLFYFYFYSEDLYTYKPYVNRVLIAKWANVNSTIDFSDTKPISSSSIPSTSVPIPSISTPIACPYTPSVFTPSTFISPTSTTVPTTPFSTSVVSQVNNSNPSPDLIQVPVSGSSSNNFPVGSGSVGGYSTASFRAGSRNAGQDSGTDYTKCLKDYHALNGVKFQDVGVTKICFIEGINLPLELCRSVPDQPPLKKNNLVYISLLVIIIAIIVRFWKSFRKLQKKMNMNMKVK